MGAIFSAVTFGAGVGTGLSAAGFGGAFVIAGFAATSLGTGLFGFTVTFDVAIGFAFVGGRAAFLGAAAL
jgi:hypothetical protein